MINKKCKEKGYSYLLISKEDLCNNTIGCRLVYCPKNFFLKLCDFHLNWCTVLPQTNHTDHPLLWSLCLPLCLRGQLSNTEKIPLPYFPSFEPQNPHTPVYQKKSQVPSFKKKFFLPSALRFSLKLLKSSQHLSLNDYWLPDFFNRCQKQSMSNHY